MRTKIGTYTDPAWGQMGAYTAAYPDGSLAVVLEESGERIATLSVCMYKPECSHSSKDLPPGCFYVKNWSENEAVARTAWASGLFTLRTDIPTAKSGFVSAPCWEIKS